MKIDKVGLLGIILIFAGFLIYVTSALDQLVTMITWPLLSGSSEGKAVLLMVIDVYKRQIIGPMFMLLKNWESMVFWQPMQWGP